MTYTPDNPEPGIYPDVPNEVYHKSAGISASGIVAFGTTSPFKFRHQQVNLKPETPSLFRGSALHSRTFDKVFELPDHYAIKPAGMSFATKDGKAWRADQEALGKTIVKEEDVTDVLGMGQAILDHPAARRLIFCKGRREHTFITKDSRRCRPDLLPDGSDLIVDLKSCRSCEKYQFGSDAANLHYHTKAAWYLDVLEELGEYRETFVWVCVESAAPYEVAIYTAHTDSAEIEQGRINYRRWWDRYQECVFSNHWPMAQEKMEALSLPQWATREALGLVASGLEVAG